MPGRPTDRLISCHSTTTPAPTASSVSSAGSGRRRTDRAMTTSAAVPAIEAASSTPVAGRISVVANSPAATRPAARIRARPTGARSNAVTAHNVARAAATAPDSASRRLIQNPVGSRYSSTTAASDCTQDPPSWRTTSAANMPASTPSISVASVIPRSWNTATNGAATSG